MAPFHVHYFQLLEEEWLHCTCIIQGGYSVSHEHDDQVNREQVPVAPIVGVGIVIGRVLQF